MKIKKGPSGLLSNPEAIKWCFEGITVISLKNESDAKRLEKSRKEEMRWGNKIMGRTGLKQWTSKFCEDLVAEGLNLLGRKNVKKTGPKRATLRKKRYAPDLECDEYVYEVKGRSWCTTGTAGEKILGVPLKYGEVPKLYKKPLQIILVGYQEYEARNAFAFGDLLNKNDQTEELKDSLAFYKNQNIEYIAFTDILKKLGLGKEYWKN